MKNTINKIKVSLTMLGVAVLSFFSKVIGEGLLGPEAMGQEQFGIEPSRNYNPGVYGVPPSYSVVGYIKGTWKLLDIIIGFIIFVVGFLSFIKIKKTDDKIQRKKRIKRTIIIISILVVLLVAVFLIPTLLLK